MFMLYRTLLKLSHPDSALASVPEDSSRVCKRVPVQLDVCRLLRWREVPVATRVDIAE